VARPAQLDEIPIQERLGIAQFLVELKDGLALGLAEHPGGQAEDDQGENQNEPNPTFAKPGGLGSSRWREAAGVKTHRDQSFLDSSRSDRMGRKLGRFRRNRH
jgi:hypothetical protein